MTHVEGGNKTEYIRRLREVLNSLGKEIASDEKCAD